MESNPDGIGPIDERFAGVISMIHALVILLIRKKVLSIRDTAAFFRLSAGKVKTDEGVAMLRMLADIIDALDPDAPQLN